MRENRRDRSLNPLEDIYDHHRVTEQEFSDIWNSLPSAPILKHETQVPNQPVNGMFVVDPSRQEWCFFLQDRWYCIGRRQPTYAIKVYDDTKVNKVGNGVFRWSIPPKYDGWYIVSVSGGNGTVGSGNTTVQISKAQGTIDILSTRIIIPGGSLYQPTGAVINEAVNQVFTGTDLWIDVDAVGTGSKGLFVYVDLERDQIAS